METSLSSTALSEPGKFNIYITCYNLFVSDIYISLLQCIEESTRFKINDDEFGKRHRRKY
jgi:hypothetical protein